MQQKLSNKWFLIFIFIFLISCDKTEEVEVASFTSIDKINKAFILLKTYNIDSNIKLNKDIYSLFVYLKNKDKSINILTKYNFYFKDKELKDLLESKFSSLSQLEIIKSNLLKSIEIFNNLNKLPDVFTANVIISGDKDKQLSVLIVSLNEFTESNKKNIELFLKGNLKENDTISISYFFINNSNELPI